MTEGPDIKGNPLRIAVALLAGSYIIGEFIFPKYHLLYLFNILGILGMIFSISIFFYSFNLY